MLNFLVLERSESLKWRSFFCICFAKNAIPSLESSIQHLSREDELFIFRLLMYTVLYNVFSTNIIF